MPSLLDARPAWIGPNRYLGRVWFQVFGYRHWGVSLYCLQRVTLTICVWKVSLTVVLREAR